MLYILKKQKHFNDIKKKIKKYYLCSQGVRENQMNRRWWVFKQCFYILTVLSQVIFVFWLSIWLIQCIVHNNYVFVHVLLLATTGQICRITRSSLDVMFFFLQLTVIPDGVWIKRQILMLETRYIWITESDLSVCRLSTTL